VVERGSSTGDYLATWVDQLVTLLFAKYAGKVRRCQGQSVSSARLGKRTVGHTDNVCSSGVDRKSSVHVQNGAIDSKLTFGGVPRKLMRDTLLLGSVLSKSAVIFNGNGEKLQWHPIL
jgi:hypothetical protein